MQLAACQCREYGGRERREGTEGREGVYGMNGVHGMNGGSGGSGGNGGAVGSDGDVHVPGSDPRLHSLIVCVYDCVCVCACVLPLLSLSLLLPCCCCSIQMADATRLVVGDSEWGLNFLSLLFINTPGIGPCLGLLTEERSQLVSA